MKKSRLREILAFLHKHVPIIGLSEEASSLVASISLLLQNDHYAFYRKDDEDVTFAEFCGFCMNRQLQSPQVILERCHHKVHPIIRRAFNSWRFDYVNTHTSIGLDDILEIPEKDVIILTDDGKQVCFDKRELLEQAAQKRPGCFRSPETNTLFSLEAVLEMEKHRELTEYAERIRVFYTHEQKIDARILELLHELLDGYLELGTKPLCHCLVFNEFDLENCSLLRTQFISSLDLFPAEITEEFFASVILVGYVGSYQPVAVSVHDIFYNNKYQCIMVEQVNLWVLLTTHRPYMEFPALVKNVGEARQLQLPPGVRLGALPEGSQPKERSSLPVRAALPYRERARSAAQPYAQNGRGGRRGGLFYANRPSLRRRDRAVHVHFEQDAAPAAEAMSEQRAQFNA